MALHILQIISRFITYHPSKLFYPVSFNRVSDPGASANSQQPACVVILLSRVTTWNHYHRVSVEAL
eukprot:scaffold192199_cov31-Attheya_sp.AAC.1